MTRAVSLVVVLAGCASDVHASAEPQPPSQPSAADASTRADAQHVEPGGPCKVDADCAGYTDCCGFTAKCGNADDRKKQHDLCNCCVSCPGTITPVAVPGCACVAGRCAAR